MAVSLPYPKRPLPPTRPPSLGSGLPKFKRLFDLGPEPIQPPPNYADRVPPRKVKDSGPFSARAFYVRHLKEENLRAPDGLAAELLQVLQGGGKPLAKGRASVLQQLVRSYLGYS